jgi:hypothetical protein
MMSGRIGITQGGPLKIIIAVLAWTVAVHPRLAWAEPTLTETEKLEQDFADPLTTLPQLFFKDAYSPATFGTHVLTNTAVRRAIIPRMPPYSLLPFVRLIRSTFTAVAVPSTRGGSRTEFGDMQLFDLAGRQFAPATTIDFGFTVAFPEFSKW